MSLINYGREAALISRNAARVDREAALSVTRKRRRAHREDRKADILAILSSVNAAAQKGLTICRREAFHSDIHYTINVFKRMGFKSDFRLQLNYKKSDSYIVEVRWDES
jgi:hypothetical protein